MQQVLQRARKPIELPDHDDIARTQVVQETLTLWPVPAAAGGLLLEQAGASGGSERGTLLCQILSFAGDAAVAQDGAGGMVRRLGRSASAVSSGTLFHNPITKRLCKAMCL